MVASLSLALAAPNLGLVLNLKWQQGQYRPSQVKNKSQIRHLFCPAMYLAPSIPTGRIALNLVHMPLQ